MSAAVGKLQRGSRGASGFPLIPAMAQVIVYVEVDGILRRAMVDSGCSQTIVLQNLVRGTSQSVDIMAIDGRRVSSGGESSCNISFRGISRRVRCLLLPTLVSNLEVILGLDTIMQFGGVTISEQGLRFGFETAAIGIMSKDLIIDDADFNAVFDGTKWTVSWKWKDEAPKLKNVIAQYGVQEDVREEYEREIEEWIHNGWLVSTKSCVDGVIPLLAVLQPNKKKVRPVMDFRELNQSVRSHTGDSEVCGDKLIVWRRMGDNVALLDLRKAYLQIHVDPTLWKYQTVKYKNSMYNLTRLGFGLNCAPKIMSTILGKVLEQDVRIRDATSHYIDDIAVDTSQISAEDVVQHLARYGLETKPVEKIDSVKPLGLRVYRDKTGILQWSRANSIEAFESYESLSRRELFSICGKLTGHYPVAGWLRIACSYIKRHSNGTKWEDTIGPVSSRWLKETLFSLESNDPVHGKWVVGKGNSGTVWCDASSIATGVALEIDGNIVEDAAWLRKVDDCAHINVAELDAVIKGVNLGYRWGLTDLKIMTDSATVHGWLHATLSNESKVKSRGISEILVMRRLGIIREMITDCGLNLNVILVRSANNKADSLTRIPQRWLKSGVQSASVGMSLEQIRSRHSEHHFGIDKTAYFVQAENPETSLKDIVSVVKHCDRCRSIDPAPVKWEVGNLDVVHDWDRLAIDVTHYNNNKYLTIVDCGPSRFAIWRRLPSEDAVSVIKILDEVFRERGPANELLMDNALSFRSDHMNRFCDKWSTIPTFRCANRPSGNGIVERNHRTIKRMAARCQADPLDMVFWYNVAPRNNCKNQSPAASIFQYTWRFRKQETPLTKHKCRYKTGQDVYKKPFPMRCTSEWPVGTVTGINSSTSVDVDGMPRHVGDLRDASLSDPDKASNFDETSDTDDAVDESAVEAHRAVRQRHRPVHLKDYEIY